MSYFKRKSQTIFEALHPKSIKAMLRGASSQELKEIRQSLRPQPCPFTKKVEIISGLAKDFGCTTLIETGTFKGDMLNATYDSFDVLYSIELSEELHKAATERFKEMPKINLIQGDSGEKLEELLKSITEPTLFWLDGHASGGVTARGELLTPILNEMKFIMNHKVKNHVIVIDDAREFGYGKGYPSLNRVKAEMKDPYRFFAVENDLIVIRN
jgi:hypothetical protein